MASCGSGENVAWCAAPCLGFRDLELPLQVSRLLFQSRHSVTALCRTVFRNAFVYNKPGQPDGVRECAERLSLVFEKEIAKM